MSLHEADPAHSEWLNRTPRAPLPDRHQLRDSVLQPVRHRLFEVALWPALETLCALGVLAWCLTDLPRERSLNLRVCQVFLMASCVALLISVARWFQLRRTIDWNGPLETIQDRLVQMRAQRGRQIRWTHTLLGPVIFSGTTLFAEQALDRINSGTNRSADLSSALWMLMAVMSAFQMSRVPLDFTNPANSDQTFWKRLLDGGSVTAIVAAVREFEYWDQQAHGTPSIRPDAIPDPTDKASPAPSRPDTAQETT